MDLLIILFIAIFIFFIGGKSKSGTKIETVSDPIAQIVPEEDDLMEDIGFSFCKELHGIDVLGGYDDSNNV